MREVDFLPAWYPAVRRRRTLFVAQLWATVAVVGLAGVGLLWQRHRVNVAQAALRADEAELVRVRHEVRQLDELVALQRQLLQKRLLVARLGVPVDLTRVVAELAECLNPTVSLSDLSARTEEKGKSMAELASERRRGGGGNEQGGISRTLRVSLVGVAPTEADVTAFYAQLAGRRFLDELRLDRSVERRDKEHVMREFEVSFAIPLDYEPTAMAGAAE